MNFLKHLILLMLAILTLNACDSLGEDSDGDPSHINVALDESFLINEKWDLGLIGANNRVDSSIRDEIKSKYRDCDKDDFYVFMEDNSTVILNRGEDFCEKSDEETLKYELNKNLKTLDIGVLFGDFENISKLKEVKFQVSVKNPDEKSIVGLFDYEIDGDKIEIIYILRNIPI